MANSTATTTADAQRRVLLVKSGGEAAIADWRRLFEPLAPHLDVRWWDDPTVPPERVDYALVWEPQPGRLAALPSLRLILSSAAGTDHITRDPAWPRHVPVIRAVTPEAAQRMGEYVCMAVLALLRDMKRMVRQQAAREWSTFESERCAWDTRVGILGLGAMGARSARMVRDLGFQTLGWSRTRKQLDGIACHAGHEELAAFLSQCDILVCLLPATPDTEGLLSAERLALLPRGAALVNVGRGSHLRLPDLVAALDASQLSGAFLDVFDEEPLPAEHPIWSHDKVFVTPHVGAIASRGMRARFFAEQIAAFESGATPAGLYDPRRGY
jgi:glyoxylate/hydroxypyruvate reductase A